MDQIKIGKFIAETRKSQKLTQRQLADALSISDKTVSKWECGKGLPEVSLMLPLCDTLRITVNDLLSGEKIFEADYQKKAEKIIMDLMKENEENKKRMALSVICGVITIIAVCALTVIASYISMPTIVRVLIIAFAVATAVAGIGAACVLEIKAGYFECPNCKALFVPTTCDYVKGYHTLTRRRLKCPECGKTGMCKHRITR
jgi:transcriptional regulator with XRE-family HTH domain